MSRLLTYRRHERHHYCLVRLTLTAWSDWKYKIQHNIDIMSNEQSQIGQDLRSTHVEVLFHGAITMFVLSAGDNLVKQWYGCHHVSGPRSIWWLVTIGVYYCNVVIASGLLEQWRRGHSIDIYKQWNLLFYVSFTIFTALALLCWD